jgi:transposase
MEYKVIRAKRAKERRRYAPEFKQKVLRECESGDQSVAAVAIKYGLNHNLVHKWRHLARQNKPSEFVRLPPPVSSVPVAMGTTVSTQVASSKRTVRLNVQIKDHCLNVDWPLEEIQSSVVWIRQLLS